MSGNSKSKNITVIDVAKKAGVSKSTVSLVLTGSNKVSDKAKQKVEKAIDDIGYVYNRDAASLRSRKSNLIAIVIYGSYIWKYFDKKKSDYDVFVIFRNFLSGPLGC